MKRTMLILLIAASAAAANAQTHAKPAVPAAKLTAGSADVQLPPGVPTAKGAVHMIYALRYQEIRIGSGAEAEPNMLYKVQYTYWLAANGQQIESTYGRLGLPLRDKDGKPVLDKDGRPKRGPDLTVDFIQSRHIMVFGFEHGLEGMRVGGKRRIFVPWQLAYGAKGVPPSIPPKADLIYDVELVDMTDPPAQPAR